MGPLDFRSLTAIPAVTREFKEVEAIDTSLILVWTWSLIGIGVGKWIPPYLQPMFTIRLLIWQTLSVSTGTSDRARQLRVTAAVKGLVVVCRGLMRTYRLLLAVCVNLLTRLRATRR